MRTQNSLRARRPQRVVEVKVRTRVLWSVPTCRTFFAYPTHGYLLPDTLFLHITMCRVRENHVSGKQT